MNIQFPKRNLQNPNEPWSHDSRVSIQPDSQIPVFQGPDGVRYEYEVSKNAWFPMYDEYLIKSQQSAYAVDGVEEDEVVLPKKKIKKNIFEQEESKESTNPNQNNNKKRINSSVYVSGLPLDVTIQEIKSTFEKYGILMLDLETGLPKIKLYKDDQGRIKGDALVTYFKPESVPLCVNLLDETELRPGKGKIKVQEAVFNNKAETEKGPKKSHTDKKRIQKSIEKLEKRLDWFEDQESEKKLSKMEKMVVLRHMFTLEELEQDPTLLLDLKQDVREECNRFGTVTNVLLYDLEPEGIMSVRFKDASSVDLCIKKMNARYFAERQIVAERMKKEFQFKQSKGNQEESQASFGKWLQEHGEEEDQEEDEEEEEDQEE